MDPLNKTTTDEPSNENVASKGRCFVAVHAGAGYHSKKHGKEYRTAMKAACAAAMHALCNGKEASDAVEAAIMELEDATATNAGVGSNLNRLGLVECDASIMTSAPSDAFGAVGAVGAVADIRNPIQGANAVRKAYAQGPDSSGLVPPMMLAGRGADLWAREQGVLMDPHNRFKITEDALARYSAYMERVEGAAERDKTNAEAIHVDEAMLMDTVGAVCIDVRGGVASGVSSGGIALKIPGRIGEASITIGRVRNPLAFNCQANSTCFVPI
ncbi:taspase, threonine aspartase, 1 [Coemansia sp. IMI 209127]|nr:taspase, threonine aspartase, 1 [Coemansia sp. IMI 209127]